MAAISEEREDCRERNLREELITAIISGKQRNIQKDPM
jgi:hypothetical protein